MNRKISIGILAYNEALVIDKTINFLLQQSLFRDTPPDICVELIVVPNGCTDDTAKVAEAQLDQYLPCYKPGAQVSWKICEIHEPGLANAWNEYIHTFSDPDAEYLFVMSADINLIDDETLLSLVKALDENKKALVSVDKRIKDIFFKEKKNLLERLSILASDLSGPKQLEGSPAWISGQLYCARAKVLRDIWIPTTLPTDDAFLYTLIVTDCLKNNPDPDKVILAKTASHSFEAYTDFFRLLKHEKWLIFGQAINEILYSDLRKKQKFGSDIGSLISLRNKEDKFWLNNLVQSITAEGRWWFIPNAILTRRFQSLRNKSPLKALIILPLATFAFIIDFVLSLQVNIALKSQGGLQNWTSSGSWGK